VIPSGKNSLAYPMIVLMQVFVSKFGRYLTVGASLVLLLALGVITSSEGVQGLLVSIPGALLFVYTLVILFWIPRVEIDEGGVRLRNIFRSHYISWGAISRIDTRWALTLFVGTKKYTAWSASAPGRHTAIFASKDQGQHLPESTYLSGTVRPGDLVTSESGAAAAVIRRSWEAKRDQNLVAAVATSWHKKTIIGSLALLTLLVITS
jgi:hypothetical protein